MAFPRPAQVSLGLLWTATQREQAMPELDTIERSDAYSPQGFLISLKAWRWFDLEAIEEAERGQADAPGRVVVARTLAEQMNAQCDFSRPKTLPARAGELVAMGLLTDILRFLMDRYCTEVMPGAMRDALEWTRAATAPAGRGTVAPPFCGPLSPGAGAEGPPAERGVSRGRGGTALCIRKLPHAKPRC